METALAVSSKESRGGLVVKPAGVWSAASPGGPDASELENHTLKVPIEIPQAEILKLFAPSARAEIERKREVLATIAYFIGKDFRMPVKLGMPGQGWYWDEERNEIRVDPGDLLQLSYDACRFIVGHEGGHRRISRAQVISERLLNTPGYMLAANIIEDPRVNNFVVGAYPTFQKPMEAAMFDSFRRRLEEDAKRSLGDVPRLLQAGFQLIRHWFEEATGKQLPPETVSREIEDLVEKILPAARRAWSVYPCKREAEEGEETVRRYARASNAIIEKEVWPHLSELVAKDLRDQLLQELLQKVSDRTGGQGLPITKPDSQGNGPAGKGGQSAQRAPGAGKGAGTSGGLAGLLKKLGAGLSVLLGGSKGEPAAADSGVSLVQDLQKKLAEGSLSAKAGTAETYRQENAAVLELLKKELSPSDCEQLNSAIKNALIKQEMREASDYILDQEKTDNSDTPPKGPPKLAPLDLSSLSQDFKARLETVIEKFESKDGQRIIGGAVTRLQEFQKRAQAEFEGKLRPGEVKLNTPEYRKSDPTFCLGGGQADASDDFIEGSGRGNIRLDHPHWRGKREGFIYSHRSLREDEAKYTSSRKQVVAIANRLEIELREIFRERHAHKWENGKRRGPSFSLRRRIREIARQVPAAETEAFRKRERPTEKDYAITLLVDLSGSMSGVKIEETFKALVVLSEVLGRLSIKTEIIGFNAFLYEYKSFHTPMSQKVRAKMGGMLRETVRSPAQYNDDGWALSEVSKRLAKQKAKEKFLIVLSDGCPAPSGVHAGPEFNLSKIIEEIRENTDQKLVGLGIGPDTHHVEAYYPNHLADIRVGEMPGRLAAFLKEVIEDYERLVR
jgi:hypothetical protein